MTSLVQYSPHIGTRGENGAEPARRIVLRVPDREAAVEFYHAKIVAGLASEVVRVSATDSTPSQAPYPLAGPLHFSVALITTFAPEPYEVKTPLPISINLSADGYSASFFDANIHTSGDNEQEAFENIKSLILDTFDTLISRQIKALGPGPAHQRSVLEQFIRKVS